LKKRSELLLRKVKESLNKKRKLFLALKRHCLTLPTFKTNLPRRRLLRGGHGGDHHPSGDKRGCIWSSNLDLFTTKSAKYTKQLRRKMSLWPQGGPTGRQTKKIRIFDRINKMDRIGKELCSFCQKNQISLAIRCIS